LIGRLAREATTRFYGPALAELPGSTQATIFSYAEPQTGAHYGYGFAHRIEHERATGRLVIEREPKPANTAGWIIGELARETRRDARGDLLARVEYETERGLPVAVRRSVAQRHVASAGHTAETRYRYDAFGNLVATTDGEGRSTYFCYDGDASFADGTGCPDALQTGSHTLLVGVLDPLREVTSFVRDAATAQIRVLQRDYSGDREGVDVDAFGRPLRAWLWPAGRASATTLEARAYFDDPLDPSNAAGRSFVERWIYVDAGSPSERFRTAIYRDGFGRALIDARPKPPGQPHPFARATASRDHAGRPLRERLDSACSDAHCSRLAIDRDRDEIRSSYDALGRIRTRETPDGIEAFEYRQRSFVLPAGHGAGSEVLLDAVLAKDAAGNLVEHLFDGERLVAANECGNRLADASTTDLSQVSCLHPSTTFYSYEASGEIEAIYDATRDYARISHRIRYRYDTLGRAWLVEDPDAGARYTSYDRVGNVTQTQDARAGSSIAFGYDALDRLTRIDRPTGIGEWDLEIRYDSRTRKRVSVTSTGSYRESWTYDDFGQLAANVRSVFDRTYRTDFVHDLLGRLRRRWLPLIGVEGVSIRYEGAFLRALCSRLDLGECDRAPGLFFVSSVEYDPLGRVSALAERPGELRFEYYASGDPEPEKAVRRLKSVRLGDGAQLDLAYRYSALGQIVGIDDAHTGDALDASATYAYDARRRLRSWADSQGTTKYFAYDALGNLVGRELASASAAPNQLYAHPD
ncbi:MAG TPA: hypothetical protein VEC18_01735, partial [Myxococcota bacterium]|nr:hypothetical protein [Myxococcota bacterium]